MDDPVMAMDGCTYERSAIEAFFRHQRQHVRPAPSTRTFGPTLERVL